MTSQEAISKIKVLLGLEEPTVQESFEATATLADGTPVHVDTEFEVGAALHVVQEDGSMVPAPEGSHTLEDGKTLVVDAAGIITSIEEAAEEAETELEEEEVEVEMAEESKEEELEEEEEKLEEEEKEEVLSAEKVVAAVLEALAPVMDEVEAMKAKFESLSTEFEAFSEAPAGKPVRNNFAQEAKNNVSKLEARQAKLLEIRKSTKK